MKRIFEIRRTNGKALWEEYADGLFTFCYGEENGAVRLKAYAPARLGEEKARTPYMGLSADEVLSSGRDLLTERLLAEGEPTLDRVEALLPRVEEGAYGFFGGAVGWSGIEIDLASGLLYSQVSENNNAPVTHLFDPATEDATLGKRKPYVFLLDDRLPIVFSVHTDGDDVMELMYFVEAGDPDRDPVVWTRTKRYRIEAPESFTLRHQVISRSRVIPQHEINADTFYTALADTVAYWLRYDAQGASFDLPEERLSRIVSAAQIASAVTFSGDHPHYGHRYYGKEMHDHFPPNFLWMIESLCVHDRLAQARRIVQHLFTFSLTDEGRFVYRQGNDELFGASACEYAQLLWLLARYAKPLQLDEDYTEQLLGMGRYLLSHLKPCEELDGARLIYMCAEADSNTRVHAYINNNLWCVRGFRALCSLLKRMGGDKQEIARFRQAADELYRTVCRVLTRDSIKDERFGTLPPFRFGYTAAPLTLSSTRDTFYPVTEDELLRYARRIDMREQGSAVQEYTENCYANYRYYPEMLGTMLLPDEQARGVLTLRENLGGEILCMTSFMGHLDDWPVLHYARFLLENGYIDKYLTLLYAHACHHGRPELACYYEQVTVQGKVMAEDCVPSLLTVPVMTAWMFAYEGMADERLSLLAGVPAWWFEKGFSAEKIGTSFGSVSITATENSVSIHFSEPPKEPFRLILRHKDSLSMSGLAGDTEHILAVSGSTILLDGSEKQYFVSF